MAGTNFPLTYKPGISRDGTNFQPNFCTDGSWIRFQRGKVKKIGGMVSFNSSALQNTFFSNLLLLPNNNDNNIFIYVASNNGVVQYIVSQDFQLVSLLGSVSDGDENYLWQSVVIIMPVAQTGGTVQLEKRVVFMATNNRFNINDTSPAIFKTGTAYSQAPLANNQFVNASPKANGGMCYSAPHLFIYGSDGIVQYSKSNNPYDFTVNVADPATGGELNIAPETGAKVIYGKAIRGGTNSPSVLFWTTSSVVRITNVGDQFTNFKRDVLSQSSSILSSRSVVEYDGTFFWIGTDRFFVFNGIVQELANTSNLNYFLDNIDMNKRQLVFGVKNTRYGEIWWFYPEKGQPPNIGCTRAIIYNKRENSWYDTAIQRDCGVYSEEFGFMVTGGKSFNPTFNTPCIFRHETNSDSEVINGITLDPRPLRAYVVTPVFSWAAFNPMQQVTGVDRWTIIKRLEPDFLFYLPQTNEGEISVRVVTKEYPQSPAVLSTPVYFNRNTTKLTLDVQGRQMQLRFESFDLFEMGHNMMLLSVGDGQ